MNDMLLVRVVNAIHRLGSPTVGQIWEYLSQCGWTYDFDEVADTVEDLAGEFTEETEEGHWVLL